LNIIFKFPELISELQKLVVNCSISWVLDNCSTCKVSSLFLMCNMGDGKSDFANVPNRIFNHCFSTATLACLDLFNSQITAPLVFFFCINMQVFNTQRL